MRATKPIVHSEYARQRAARQAQSFGAWAKRLMAIVGDTAPEAAGRIELSNWKHCDELYGLYEKGLTQEQAAASEEFASIDWTAPRLRA